MSYLYLKHDLERFRRPSGPRRARIQVMTWHGTQPSILRTSLNKGAPMFINNISTIAYTIGYAADGGIIT